MVYSMYVNDVSRVVCSVEPMALGRGHPYLHGVYSLVRETDN